MSQFKDPNAAVALSDTWRRYFGSDGSKNTCPCCKDDGNGKMNVQMLNTWSGVVWKILFSYKAIVSYLAWIPQLLHIICDRLWKGRILPVPLGWNIVTEPEGLVTRPVQTNNNSSCFITVCYVFMCQYDVYFFISASSLCVRSQRVNVLSAIRFIGCHTCAAAGLGIVSCFE